MKRKQPMQATLWRFEGMFFGGDRDAAGVEIGDICTGNFATITADPTEAQNLLEKRYADFSGRFSVGVLEVAPQTRWAAKTLARVMKRGGTKQIPLLA
jgi:hypothetical protein